MEKIIELDRVSAGYGRHLVIDRLSFSVAPGDFFGLIGPNGAGKTTLLRVLLGLQKPWRGSIVRAPGVRFGYCLQRQHIDEIFPFTVGEIVMMGRTAMLGPLVRPGPADRERVAACLRATEIEPLAGRRFNELSGGQKQRALIARALATEANCLVLDEPTNDLDIRGSREILALLEQLHRELRLTVILVSHELERVLNHARHFLFLDPGRRAILAAREEISQQMLRDLFGLELTLKKINGELVIV